LERVELELLERRAKALTIGAVADIHGGGKVPKRLGKDQDKV